MDGEFKVPQNPKIFNHEELEEVFQKEKDRKQVKTYKTSKHSLDSDEEDDDEKAQKYNVLDPNELEGQEEGTIDFDGEIKITPFNMKEELEEGYFDKDGTYIFNKEDEEVKDQWLTDIDWVKIKAQETTKRKQEDESESSDEEKPPIDLTSLYKQMIDIMKPGETVQKAICRLGGSKSSRSASSRWKKKKESPADPGQEDTKDVEKLQLLTSLADQIIQSGDMDVYQQTFEKMTFHISSFSKSGLNGSTSAEAELDMFGDDFDEKVDENKKPLEIPRTPSPTADPVLSESDVTWEFKWEEAEDAKVYGPYPTSQMQQWVDEKYFDQGVLVRQVGKQDASFYSSKRIDFELYL